MKEYLGLIGTTQLEQSPTISLILREIANALPAHFNSPRFIPAPINTNLSHVVRSDCSDKKCGTRGIIHIIRNRQGKLVIQEKKFGRIRISFDRNSNCCSKCNHLI